MDIEELRRAFEDRVAIEKRIKKIIADQLGIYMYEDVRP